MRPLEDCIWLKVQKQEKRAHLRQIIRGVGKSWATQRICIDNWESAELSGVMPKPGSMGHEKSGHPGGILLYIMLPNQKTFK